MAISYNIYANDGMGGDVDYSTPIATTSDLTYATGPLATPSDNTFAVRAFDTASCIEEANTDARVRIILDASGNLNSSGMLIGGKTIHVNLTSLVNFGNAVTANLTVVGSVGAGFITLWSGAVARPGTSVLNYEAGQTLSNLTVTGLAEFSTAATDTIAIFANVTTHLVLDVAGFAVGNFGQVNPKFVASAMTPAVRARRARQALVTPRKF